MHKNTEQNAANRKRLAPEPPMTRREFCEYYGFNYRTVEGWAHRGEGPRVTRLGGRAYYTVADIKEWLEEQRKKSDTRFAKEKAK